MEVFVAFDVETTGLKPGDDQLTEIAAIKFDRYGREIGRFSTLVNPGKPIPRHLQGKIPITDKMVRLGPTPQDAVAAFKAFVGDAMFVGHNPGFDRNFISAVDPSFANREFLDTEALARVLLPGRPNYRLVSLVKDQGLDRFHRQPHRAWSDAYVTAKLFRVLVECAEHMPAAELAELRADKAAAPGSWATFLNDVVHGNGVGAEGSAKAERMSNEHFTAWWTKQFGNGLPTRSNNQPEKGRDGKGLE